MKEKVRTLFIGTSDFAVPILEKLFKLDYLNIVGIVTQPDKPYGRLKKMRASPVREHLIHNNIKIDVFQPINITRESDIILNKSKPDLILVASYGQFIPKNMLDYPKYRCLNVHVSILPDLRGAVPMPIAILKGYQETGVTVQIMEEGMDVGDIIGIKKIQISNIDTTKSLIRKASFESVLLLSEILLSWINGMIKPVKQDNSKATYCYMSDISKEKAEIDWNKSADEIDRKVRAFYPWPIAWFKLSQANISNAKFFGKICKIYSVDTDTNRDLPNYPIGRFFKHNKNLFIQAKDKALKLKEIQVEGKKRMEGKDYLFLLNE